MKITLSSHLLIFSFMFGCSLYAMDKDQQPTRKDGFSAERPKEGIEKYEEKLAEAQFKKNEYLISYYELVLKSLKTGSPWPLRGYEAD